MDDKTTRAQSYQNAGVSLHAAEDAVERYKRVVKKTFIPGVLGGLGGFGGMFSLKDAGLLLDDPILVSGTDGVGTKLRLAFELDTHDTIGIDCVAMCVNDVITTGAKPLFFLDYLATGKLLPAQAEAIVTGIASGCLESGCALIGGETAEMPGFFAEGEYDVAGFCVGVVDRSEVLGPQRVKSGDVLIGLPSSGFHSNGYSLVRKIISDAALPLGETFPDGGKEPLGTALLKPTRLYPAALQSLPKGSLHAAAHITGGGFFENLPRVLPDGFGALISKAWDVPPVMRHIMRSGNISAAEGFHVFNMGIGMILVVDANAQGDALKALEAAGFGPRSIGVVTQTGQIEIEMIAESSWL